MLYVSDFIVRLGLTFLSPLFFFFVFFFSLEPGGLSRMLVVLLRVSYLIIPTLFISLRFPPFSKVLKADQGPYS